jgi:hypothetical protein
MAQNESQVLEETEAGAPAYEPPVLAEAVSLASATLQPFSGTVVSLDAGFIDFGGP